MYAMQEAEGIGTWLLEAIATSLKIPLNKDTAAAISQHVYDASVNGVTVTFDEYGILVTTAVEGYDAEYAERVEFNDLLDTDDADVRLCTRFWEAVQTVEEAANDFITEECGYEDEAAYQALLALQRPWHKLMDHELTEGQRRRLRIM